MPVLECPICRAVIAWRGKALSVPCPGDEHPPHRRPTLHVDRDAIRRNGHAIEHHQPDYGADARAADRKRGRELLAVNWSKGS